MKTLGLVLFLTVFYFNATAQKEGDIYSVAEKMPAYPGGTDSLLKDITNAVVYPKPCIDSGIQGKVFLRFVVDETGDIQRAAAVKGPHPLLNEAAVQAVYKLRHFIPGEQNGRVVKVWYSLPVTFKLKADTSNYTKLPSDSLKTTTKLNGEVYDTIPQFPGGEGALLEFFLSRINPSDLTKPLHISGEMKIKFTVFEDGSAHYPVVLQKLNPDLDAQAINIVKLLPPFKPAYLNNKPVKAEKTVSFGFKINHEPNNDPSNYGITQLSAADLKSLPNITIADVYPGGRFEFYKTLHNNTVYPPERRLQKKEAVILVQCVWDKNLKLKPVRVLNDCDSLFSQAATKAIENVPPFTENQPYYREQLHVIQVEFALNENNYADAPNSTRKIDKLNAAEYYEKGMTLYKAEKFQKAIEQFEYALKEYPLSADALYTIGLCKMKLGDNSACTDLKDAYLLGALAAEDDIILHCQ